MTEGQWIGKLTFCGVISYCTEACKPLRIRFSDMVSKSLAARMESMMVMNDASTSGGTSRKGMINKRTSVIDEWRTYTT